MLPINTCKWRSFNQYNILVYVKNWVCKGLLEDPFLEFFVYKNEEYTNENLKELYYDFYWDKKYLIEKKNVYKK